MLSAAPIRFGRQWGATVIIVRVLRRLISGTARGLLHRWPTTLLTLILLGGAGYALIGQGMIPGVRLPELPGFTSAGSTDTREMTVEDLRQARGGEQINLVLKEKSGNRRLVMAIGPGEALAIRADLINLRDNRPMTYDLMQSLVQELGAKVNHVVVSNVSDTTFFAKVVMSTDSRQIEVDSRPSDAIALALRSKAPILADVSVLDKAGVLNPN